LKNCTLFSDEVNILGYLEMLPQHFTQFGRKLREDDDIEKHKPVSKITRGMPPY